MTAAARDDGDGGGGGRPLVSLVVLAWDNLPLTQACVASLRTTTDVSYELIIVDNGSAPEAAAWARDNADVAVLHEENLGFARGMNAGLQAASGEVVAFVNNDTVWPEGWAGPLLEHFADPAAPIGIVAPAVTAAGNPVTVRDAPGDEVLTLDPFSALPSGVAYLMRTAVVRELGGWSERYDTAMGEDLDLCFTCWANGLDVVLDTRVLVHHELHATLEDKLPERDALFRRNLDRFLETWTTTTGDGIGRLGRTGDEAFADGLAHARAGATWLQRLDTERRRHRQELRELRAEHADGSTSGWSRVMDHLRGTGSRRG